MGEESLYNNGGVVVVNNYEKEFVEHSRVVKFKERYGCLENIVVILLKRYMIFKIK